MTEKNPKKPQTIRKKYICKKCAFSSSNKKDYDKHLLTKKHKNQYLSIKKSIQHNCEICNKTYKDASGLWRHNKKFHNNNISKKNPKSITSDSKSELDSELVLKVLEENKELRKLLTTQQEQISGLIPKVGNNNTSNQFNLNFFLNEQCKDAINWDEFIKSIQIGVSNLDCIISSNLTNGITQVLCKSIDELGVYKRPVHCLDTKRKKLCIKNENSWVQDPSKNKEILEKHNRKLQQHHFQLILDWQEQNPGWKEDEHLKDIYIKMIQSVMGDVDDDKCLAEISKHAIIPKDEI